MPIEVKKKGNETPDKLMARFNRLSQRIVKGLRRGRAFVRNKSALKIKTAAVIREGYRAERARKKFYN
jgi:hypothetical protein